MTKEKIALIWPHKEFVNYIKLNQLDVNKFVNIAKIEDCYGRYFIGYRDLFWASELKDYGKIRERVQERIIPTSPFTSDN